MDLSQQKVTEQEWKFEGVGKLSEIMIVQLIDGLGAKYNEYEKDRIKRFTIHILKTYMHILEGYGSMEELVQNLRAEFELVKEGKHLDFEYDKNEKIGKEEGMKLQFLLWLLMYRYSKLLKVYKIGVRIKKKDDNIVAGIMIEQKSQLSMNRSESLLKQTITEGVHSIVQEMSDGYLFQEEKNAVFYKLAVHCIKDSI